MIGTGVFTSLGFQLLDISNGYHILFLWLCGGFFSLAGAWAYGEIGAAFPRNGGEYQFLSKVIHPFAGYLAGWVSATVGFAAPVALAASLMGGYAAKIFPGLPEQVLSLSVVLLITLVHAKGTHTGSRFQNVFTTGKVLLIAVVVLAGFLVPNEGSETFGSGFSGISQTLLSKGFVVSLFFVSYSYSGWNASSYMAGEIENPSRNLHRSLLLGTGIVTLLYVLLNLTFLLHADAGQMRGVKEVAYAPAAQIFGSSGASLISACIVLFLVSSVSSMVMTGPRVIATMGEDFSVLRFFAKKNSRQVPAAAAWVQAGISVLLLLTGSFSEVLTYLGFTLNLFTFLTVAGYTRYRVKHGPCGSYAAPAYYLFASAFLLYAGFLLVMGLVLTPKESLAGMLTLVAGGLFYLFSSRK
jgi:APA family basic amino acid/polyamine antiporter